MSRCSASLGSQAGSTQTDGNAQREGAESDGIRAELELLQELLLVVAPRCSRLQLPVGADFESGCCRRRV